MTTPNTQASHIFRAAILYIQNHGWQKGELGEHGKPRNSMGSLLSATPGVRWNQELAVIMYAALSHRLGARTLTKFDAQAKNQEEVIKLFEQVANDLESEW